MEAFFIVLSCKFTPCSCYILPCSLLATCVPCIGVLGVSMAQTVTIDPVGPVTVVEGNNLTINCTDGNSSGSTMRLREDGIELISSSAPPYVTVNLTRTFALLANRTKNANSYDCFSATRNVSSLGTITLTVACKWKRSVVRF